MSVDVRPLRELAAARKKSEGPERTLAMRDAGEALAERLRAEPGVDGLETLDLGTMVFESSQVLAGWRAPTSLAVLRRRGWLVRAGGVRALVDPRTDEPVTPYEERLAQRHPLRGRAAGCVPLRGAIERRTTACARARCANICNR